MGKKKKEKVLELKERKEKVSKKHLDEMIAVANKINALQFNIGRLESQKHKILHELALGNDTIAMVQDKICLLYTSPSPRDRQKSRMPSSA